MKHHLLSGLLAGGPLESVRWLWRRNRSEFLGWFYSPNRKEGGGGGGGEVRSSSDDTWPSNQDGLLGFGQQISVEFFLFPQSLGSSLAFA